MTRIVQPDLFGGQIEHYELEKQRRERERNEHLRSDHEYACRSLILNCLNRRGPMTDKRIGELLGLAPIDVGTHLATLRSKSLVIDLGQDGDAWIYKAVARWEEVA